MGKQTNNPKKKKEKKHIFRHVFYLNNEENEKFLQEYARSGKKSESKFIACIVLGKPVKIVQIDKTALDIYIKLTSFYTQFQAIGNNYNQVVKAIKTNYSEKRAIALLIQLEKYTLQLCDICDKIMVLIQEYEQKWLQK